MFRAPFETHVVTTMMNLCRTFVCHIRSCTYVEVAYSSLHNCLTTLCPNTSSYTCSHMLPVLSEHMRFTASAMHSPTQLLDSPTGSQLSACCMPLMQSNLASLNCVTSHQAQQHLLNKHLALTQHFGGADHLQPSRKCPEVHNRGLHQGHCQALASSRCGRGHGSAQCRGHRLRNRHGQAKAGVRSFWAGQAFLALDRSCRPCLCSVKQKVGRDASSSPSYT